MRINSLEIQNFRVLKHARLSFPDQVIGIVGQYGAGKSSLIEAIAWALYGNQAARTGKDEIKSTFAKESDICEVKVKFSINDDSYTVIRRLSGKSDRAEVELYRGDSSESVGVNETKNYVGQLLGLDWRGFLSSFLARQSELNALSDLAPAKRRDHIAGMLGIQRLDKAIIRVKEDTKQAKEKVLFLQKHLIDKDAVEKAIIELNEKISALKLPLTEQQAEAQKSEQQFKTAQTEFERISEKRIQNLKLQADLSARKETSRQLFQQQKKLELEQTSLVETEKTLSRLEAEKKSFSHVEPQLQVQLEAKNSLELHQNLTAQLKALAEKKTSLSSQQKTTAAELEELNRQFRKLPPNLEDLLQQAKLDLEEKRTAYSQTRAGLDQLQSELKKNADQLSRVSELKADSVCERCRRPYGDDYQTIRKHIEIDQSQLQSAIKIKDSELSSLKQAGVELKTKVEKFELDEKLRFSLSTRLEALKKDAEKISLALSESESVESGLKTQLEKIGTIRFDKTLFETLTSQREQLTKINESIHTCLGSLARKDAIKSDLEENIIAQTQITASINELKQQLTEIGYSDELFAQLSEKFNRSRDIFEKEKNKLLSLTREIELTESSLNGKIDQKKQFEKSELEFEQTKTAQYYGEKLTTLLTLFRQNLIASIRPSLADAASRLFDEMTDHKYSLVELDEKYDLRVMDNGVYYGVERFSGGEKDLANLCLRLAISMALTESAGLSRSFVILDEVFGSQDNERKELILKSLANLKNSFPQIFLITHVEDIKDGVEQVLEVTAKEAGYSEVSIHES